MVRPTVVSSERPTVHQLKPRPIELPIIFATCCPLIKDAIVFFRADWLAQNSVDAGDCLLLSSGKKKPRALLAFPVHASQDSLSPDQCALVAGTTFGKCSEVTVTIPDNSKACAPAKTLSLRTEPKLYADRARLFETSAAVTLAGLPVIVGQEFEFKLAGQRVVLIVEEVNAGMSVENDTPKHSVTAVTDQLNSMSISAQQQGLPVNGEHTIGKGAETLQEPIFVFKIAHSTTFSIRNTKQPASVPSSPFPHLKSSTIIQRNVTAPVSSSLFAGYEQQRKLLTDLLLHAYHSACAVTTINTSSTTVTPFKSKRLSTPRSQTKSLTAQQDPVLPPSIATSVHAKTLLVYGVSGVGKTLFVRHALHAFAQTNTLSESSNKSSLSPMEVSVLDIPPLSFLISDSPSAATAASAAISGNDADNNTTSSSRIIRIIEQRLSAENSNTFLVVVIDELDLLIGKSASNNDHTSVGPSDRKAYAVLCQLLDYIHRSTHNIFLIAITRLAESLPTSLRRAGRFDIELELPPPSCADRVALLKTLLIEQVKPDDKIFADHQLDALCRTLHGYVYCDLQSLVMHAVRLTGYSFSLPATVANLTVDILYRAMQSVKPSAMREIVIDVPDTRWADIGGYVVVKRRMRQSVEWAVHDQPARFRAYGITPPRGVLLFGPPGCSKTLMAKAIACEAGLNFLTIKGPELFNKYVGESERAVREVFRRARFAAPACIFIDEIDALGGQRSGGNNTSSLGSSGGGGGVGDRMLATLLNELDGVEELKQVVVIAATNRPDVIDKALLRPGRLDRIIYVPLPDDASRKEILLGRMARMLVDDDLTSDLNVEELVAKTSGYSGAELVAVCQEAGMIMLEDVDIRPNASENAEKFVVADLPKVTMKQFLTALGRVKPRTQPDTVRFYESWAQMMAFGND